MKNKKIKIGYEINTGEEVFINKAHTVITGLTQESGKTTTIMGLIRRSGLKAIIIKTKIGEKAITEGSIIPPFYKEDFDWEYASELLESSRKEKLKFERSWIIKYSKNANSLLEFKSNIDNALADEKLRGWEKSVLITLQAYLEKILPELQYAPLSKTLDIKEGINIMDLERFKEETQSLIIRSVLNEVLTKEKNTIVIIPEAWRYIPERVANPVKGPAEAFIRQGATNNNYLWIDSQDVTGVSKVILKQVSNWILGYQREINEIKRTLDQLPLSKRSRPNPEEIATLKLGQFFVATSEYTKKVYAQPSWIDNKTAKNVALGKISIEDIEQSMHIGQYQIITKPQEQIVPSQNISTLDSKKIINELREDFITNKNNFFTKFEQINESIAKLQTEMFNLKQNNQSIDEDEIIMRILQKIPVNTNSPINKDEIISEVLSRIPKTAGAVTYEVAPLEKIKKDFLEEAKNKILSDIGNLDDKQKKILKWTEQNNKSTNKREIFLNCFGKSATGGGTYTALGKKVLEMKILEIIRMDTQQRVFPFLKQRIQNLIAQYEATEQEIQQVYDHILAELL